MGYDAPEPFDEPGFDVDLHMAKARNYEKKLKGGSVSTEKFPTVALTNIAAFLEAQGEHSSPEVIREALSAHAATEAALAPPAAGEEKKS